MPCVTPEEIKLDFENFFKGLFMTSSLVGVEGYIAVLPRRVSDGMNASLLRELKSEEISDALN